MFAAILAYQLIDLLLAAGLAALLTRGAFEAWTLRLAPRFPRLLATPFRRLALLTFPAFLLLLLGAAAVGRSVLHRAFNVWAHGHPELQRAANIGTFLFLGIAYLGICLLFPLLGAWRAWREPAGDPLASARRRRDRQLAAVAIAGAAATFGYATFYEPNRIVVEQADVALAGWPADRPALRIVLLADLQSALLGERERRVPGIVASLRPDLIVIAGDLVAQSFDESLPLAQARHVLTALAALAPPLGVYAVNGDVDDAVEGGIRRTVAGTGVRLLDNESVLLASDPPIELLGYDPREVGPESPLLHAPPQSPLRIGLVHRPRHYAALGAALGAAGCGLVLAGHTHGGQVVLPGFGPIMTYETVPRAVAAGGLHRMGDGTQLYVTRGLGREGGFAPPVRFLCPPEITLLRVGPPAPPSTLDLR